MNINSSVELNDENQMPLFGLGTWQSENGNEAKNAVLLALKNGYRHIDTARIYGNEESVGQAIKESGIPRDQIFVTTKLWNDDHGDPEKALKQSLERLGLDYVDLYLIHWPVTERLESWKMMKKFKDQGLCKSIGVSNFTVKHLEELLKNSDVVPTVNQVEFSPFNNQKELLEYCKSKNIQLEAYSPLTRGIKLENQVLKEIASNYGKTTAQIILKWILQKNIVVIPKSTNESRIIENSEIYDFEISDSDMEKLESLNEDFRQCPNPEEMP